MNKTDKQISQLIDFSDFNTAKLYPQVKKIIKQNNTRIKNLIKDNSNPEHKISWDNFSARLENWNEELFSDLFDVAGHLKSVCDNSKLRNAYNKCLPHIAEYVTALKQNEQLYLLLKKLRKDGELDAEQKQSIDNHLRDCRLSGIELPKAQKNKFAKLVAESSRLSAKFNENVLDSTDKWQEVITDKTLLAGIPQATLDDFKQNAKQEKLEGWLLRLDPPSYLAIMNYAENRQLRERVYRAYNMRASKKHPLYKSYDNNPIINKILAVRNKKAQILGYKNPAEMLMATNMVKQPQKIVSFLEKLMRKVLPAAKKEADELMKFALKYQDDFQPWDIIYFGEKLQQENFQVDKEVFREYFPLPRVLEGMFTLAEKLFGVYFIEQKNSNLWHKDVRLFKLVNKKDETIGHLYCDLYARQHKNGGAWMNESIIRRRLSNDSLRLPAAYLVCNFRKPFKGNSLLLHNEVLVLFHELGHCLHHLLTKIEQPQIAGINGVPHDMIELPSQLLENWCWDKKFIKKISAHYKTGKPLPARQLDNLSTVRNFQSGLNMLRQLELSLFDILLHSKYNEADIKKSSCLAQDVYDELHYKYNPLPQMKEACLPNSFGHIFAGGYAAGYYAYKWAEVMSADIYSMFEENGIYHKPTAQLLRQNIFERGGLGNALQNFTAVRGRKPDNKAFLRYNGIAT